MSAGSENYLRQQEVLTLWSQVVGALQAATSPLASGIGTVMSIAQDNSQTLILQDGRIGVLESYFDGDIPKKAVSALGTSGNTLTWSYGGVAQTAITVPYATSAGNADTLDGKHDSYFATASGLDSATQILSAGLGGVQSIAEGNCIELRLHDSRLIELESFFDDGISLRSFADKNGLQIDTNYLKLSGGVMANGAKIGWKNSSNTAVANLLEYSSGNVFFIGWDQRTTADTRIYGNAIKLYAGDSMGNTPSIVINSSKDVGIGYASPSYKLHVNGEIHSGKDIVAEGGVVAKGICDLSMN